MSLQSDARELEKIQLLNLPIYNSTSSLSSSLSDYSNVFLLPAICVFGIVTNLVNIIVLCKTKLSENIHLYMFISSVSDLAFLLTQVFIALIRCGTLCPYGYTYAANAYGAYVYIYFGYTVLTFSALAEIFISIDRIMLFNNRGKIITRRDFALRSVILLVVAAVLMLPDQVLARDIVPIGALEHTYRTNSSTVKTYELLYSKTIKKSWLVPTIQVPLTILSIARGPCLIGMIFVVNIVVVAKFRNHLNKKRRMTKSNELRENNDSNRATVMIITASFLYFSGNLLDSFAAILELFKIDVFDVPMYVVFANCLLFGSHGLYIFIYYNYNKNFKRIFLMIFWRRIRRPRPRIACIRGSSSELKSTQLIQFTSAF